MTDSSGRHKLRHIGSNKNLGTKSAGRAVKMRRFLWAAFAAVLATGLAGSGLTQEQVADQTEAAAVDPGRGAVTNLPLPRFVSLKGTEGNARRGPGLTHRIDWVFTRRDMPLEVTAEFENWRLVQDKDGAGGWVHYTLLSGVRTVIVETNMTDLYATPDERAPVIARLESGVVGRITECSRDWCRVSAGGERGWAPKAQFWGVADDEVLD